MSVSSLIFHFCDALWEYRSNTRSVFLHKDGMDPDMCGRWMSYEDVSLRYQERHVGALDEETWRAYLSPEAMEAFAHGAKREDSFYIRVGNNRNGQEWHEVHLQRVGDDIVYLASKDIREMRRSSAIAKAMVPEFDYVGCIDPSDGSYVLYYSDASKEAIPQSRARDYARTVEENIGSRVIPEERDGLLRAMRLESVIEALEESDEYVLFCTMQEADGVSYKRLRFSYEDEGRERILLTRVDTGALMGERRLRERERAKRVQYLDNMPVPFHSVKIVLDADGRPVDFTYTYCNRAYGELEGVDAGELVGKNYYELFPGDDRKWLDYYYDTAYNGTPHVVSAYGPRLRKHLLVYTFRSEFGDCECALLDVTEQRVLMHELERSRATMRRVLELTTDRVFEYFPTRNELLMDGRDGESARLLPVDGLDAAGAREVHLRAECRGDLRDAFAKIRAGERSASVAIQARADVDSPWKWMRVTMFDFQDGTEQGRSVLGFMQNIDEFRSREEELLKQAESDSLTGLLNAGAGRRRVNERVEAWRSGGEGCCAMLVMDLDDFKTVNDTLGHMAGDRVLLAFAEVLRGSFRAEDTVCRLGGDEFMVYVDSLVSPGPDIRAILDRILDNVGRARADHPELGCSIGAFVTDRGYTFEDLYMRADRELYRAKRTGKGRFSVGYDI